MALTLPKPLIVKISKPRRAETAEWVGVSLFVGTGQAVSTLKIPIHISSELSLYCERSF